MKSKRKGKKMLLYIILIPIIIIIAALFSFTYIRYRSDIRSDYDRLEALGSKTIETDHGTVQYAELGDGYPLLIIHGIFGGFDQGLITARDYYGEGFHAIVPSRFGYLGTPLPKDALPSDQADAFASLLDSLDIKKTAVMATSAGGTSAIQFVLRHPERVSALVLISSNAPGETEAGLPPKPVAKVFFRSNYVFWLLSTYFSSNLQGIMGVPKGFEMTPENKARVAAMIETVLPVNPRSDGAIYDMFISNFEINSGYPIHEITTPVLIVSALDDPLTLYKNAVSLAKEIPGAELITVQDGGHLLLGHDDEVKPKVVGFLKKYTLEDS